MKWQRMTALLVPAMILLLAAGACLPAQERVSISKDSFEWYRARLLGILAEYAAIQEQIYTEGRAPSAEEVLRREQLRSAAWALLLAAENELQLDNDTARLLRSAALVALGLAREAGE